MCSRLTEGARAEVLRDGPRPSPAPFLARLRHSVFAGALIALLAFPVWNARGQERPPASTEPGRPAENDPTSRPILPGARPPGEPTPIPSSLPAVVYPFPSLQILIGSDFLDVSSNDPEIDEHAGTPFSTGAVFGIDFVGETWRLGYLRRVYRHSLGAGTEFRGQEAEFLAIEADALWAHGGWRPWRAVYAGLGLSLQQRKIEFAEADGGGEDNPVLLESVVAGEFLLEYAFALPFAVQARYARDLSAPRIELNGWTVVIAYTIPL